jgi:F0F1-type ATP synthase delta subunit
MTRRTAAARYARALLDVGTKEGVDLDRIGRELGEFTTFLAQQTALERLLLNLIPGFLGCMGSIRSYCLSETITV